MENNVQHIELFTKQGIFIPQISISYTSKIVKTIFKLCNIGYVDTIEFIPLKENEEMQSAIVYFENVILSDFSYQLADQIINYNCYKLHLEDDECWILIKNKNPTSERALMNQPFSLREPTPISKQMEDKINQLEERIEEQENIINEQANTIQHLMKNIKSISRKFNTIVEHAQILQMTMNREKNLTNTISELKSIIIENADNE